MKEEIKDNLLKSIVFEPSDSKEEERTGTISENVVYHICGYMIHKYRKYSCRSCLDTINLDPELLPERLTVEKLTLMRSRGRLKLATNNFFRLISMVESSLQQYSLVDDILQTGAFQHVLNSVTENELPVVGCQQHSATFVVTCIYDYLLLRFKAIARRKKQERVEALAARRHANRKMSKIATLNKVPTTTKNNKM